jgi:D-alanyl-D-alanine carboxypeptidase
VPAVGGADRAGAPLLGGVGSASPRLRAPSAGCRLDQARAVDPSLADLPWEQRLQRVAGRLHGGVAVGLGGQVAFEHNGVTPRVPASNQKLLLSFALFDSLGPRFRIPTRAAAKHVEEGVVPGNLWVLGRGDPTLTAAEPGYWGTLRATTLSDLAARIKRAGVTRVEGSVMGAVEYFAHDFDAPGWQSYVPGRFVELPSSLVLNGNNVVSGLPERAVAAALTKRLERIGVGVSESPGAGRSPSSLARIAEVRSRPLGRIVSYMNRSSNNFFAEVLGKLLGARVLGSPGTIAKGARAIEAWVRDRGLSAAASDSSGLSYRNRLSPRTMVQLLGVAESRPWIGVLRDGLPGPGDGTLEWRLPGLDVRAKTGTLFNGASALSGWVRSASTNRWVEFSILGRGTPKRIEDRMVRVLSRAHIRAPKVRPDRACRRMGSTSSEGPAPERSASPAPAGSASIEWRRSTALGTHTAGRLVNGVRLPSHGRHFFTWDPVTKSSPNRSWRRFGTDRLVRTLLTVLRTYAEDHPRAPRVGIGDLSRPRGGGFGRSFGGLGHSSHQNGLDVDVYYPRRDGRERAPRSPDQVDRRLAQDLVDLFVRAGAELVFVGENTGLSGRPTIVQPLAHHDDHMHVRLPLRPKQ